MIGVLEAYREEFVTIFPPLQSGFGASSAKKPVFSTEPRPSGSGQDENVFFATSY